MPETRRCPVETPGKPRPPHRLSWSLLPLRLLPLLVIFLAPLIAPPPITRALDSTPTPRAELGLRPVTQGAGTVPGAASGFVWLVQSSSSSGPRRSVAAPLPLGFVLPRSGSLAVFDHQGATLARLHPGEASFLPDGSERAFGSGDGGPVRFFQIALVPAEAVPQPLPGGTRASEPFTVLAGDIVLELEAGTLDSRAAIELPASAYPTLLLVTEGIITVREADGGARIIGTGESALLDGAALTRNAGERRSRFVLIQLSPATVETAEERLDQVEQAAGSRRLDPALDAVWERNGCPLNPANPPCLVIAQAAACVIDPAATRCTEDSDGDGCLDIGEVRLGLDAFDTTDCLPNAGGLPAVNCLFPIANQACGKATRGQGGQAMSRGVEKSRRSPSGRNKLIADS